jgi:hypothetical protein
MHKKIVVRKPEDKRPLGRPRHSWEDNIRMELWEIGWEGVGGIWLKIHRTVARSCEYNNEPSVSRKHKEILD